MRRIVVLMMILMAILTACGVSTRGEIPYGVWKSEEPNITLYFDPEVYREFSGVYVKDGESINIIIIFATSAKAFSIYDESLFYSGKNRTSADVYYYGYYRVRGNKLRYNLVPHWQERTGIKTIVFEKVSDYEIE